MKNLIVSIDFQQIELVLIGEFSGDPAFAEAYGQIPFSDLHLTAACAVTSALNDYPVKKEEFKKLKLGDNPFPFTLLDTKGNELPPDKFYGFMRGTAGGKGANFEFWYSRWLANLGQRWNLHPTQTQVLVEAYIKEFETGVRWRDETINMARITGYVELPDGHRRVKHEATPLWKAFMQGYFQQHGERFNQEDAAAVRHFGNLVIRKVQTRAGNQLINALIQGSCATLAKRSLLRIMAKVKELGLHVRFLQPIHDELVFSVRADEVWDFIVMAKAIMADHPTIIKNLKINSTASVGRTFQAWDALKSPLGQIELDEAPKASFIPPEFFGKALPKEAANDVIMRLAA